MTTEIITRSITRSIARSRSYSETVSVTARDAAEYKALRSGLIHRDTGREDFVDVDVDDTDPSRVRVEVWGADWRVHLHAPAAPTAERLERLASIIRASDDEGTIQADDMLRLFPGRPTLHTTTDVRSALAAAGATAADLRALARATDDDEIEACARHQAQTWDDAAE